MTNDSLVSIVNTTVYGRSKKFAAPWPAFLEVSTPSPSPNPSLNPSLSLSSIQFILFHFLNPDLDLNLNLYGGCLCYAYVMLVKY